MIYRPWYATSVNRKAVMIYFMFAFLRKHVWVTFEKYIYARVLYTIIIKGEARAEQCCWAYVKLLCQNVCSLMGSHGSVTEAKQPQWPQLHIHLQVQKTRFIIFTYLKYKSAVFFKNKFWVFNLFIFLLFSLTFRQTINNLFRSQFVRARSCFVSIWHCDLCTCIACLLLFFLTEEKTKRSPPTMALPVKKDKKFLSAAQAVYCWKLVTTGWSLSKPHGVKTQLMSTQHHPL